MSGARAVVAEALGTALLVATVVGSGIMGQRLAQGNEAIALLANTVATGAALVALISTFAPISGAHFNPLVTGYAALTGTLPLRHAALYVIAQLTGGIVGALLANAMFGLEVISFSVRVRHGAPQLLSEAVATFGLFAVILSTSKRRPEMTAVAVACYIVAAYWFTASTSFANPAVTVARVFSDSFAGIRAADVLGFVAAQAAGALVAFGCFHWLLGDARRAEAEEAVP